MANSIVLSVLPALGRDFKYQVLKYREFGISINTQPKTKCPMLPGFIVNQRFLSNTLKILKIFGETPKIFALLKIFSDQRFLVKDF